MKRLKLLITLFVLLLSIPMGYFIVRTLLSLEQEEAAEMRYFAETLFDAVEEDLSAIVAREEMRSVDEYNYFYTPPNSSKPVRSPLSFASNEKFMIGYFQNNPDGTFDTPLNIPGKADGAVISVIGGKLKDANRIINEKRETSLEPAEVALKIAAAERLNKFKEEANIYESKVTLSKTEKSKKNVSQKEEYKKSISIKKKTKSKKSQKSIADKYVVYSRSKERKSYLGRQDAQRTEEITQQQARNISRAPQKSMPAPQPVLEAEDNVAADEVLAGSSMAGAGGKGSEGESASSASAEGALDRFSSESFKVEIDPIQSVFIDSQRIFLYRRIVLKGQVYRQGFLIDQSIFLKHISEKFFDDQPLANFAMLGLSISGNGEESTRISRGADSSNPEFTMKRRFPRPFSFLEARLLCDELPKSKGRRVLVGMLVLVGGVVLVGLFSIYYSARAIVIYSERRSDFVSSVTHELKTPLTNIRMYIEMLEQGIAATPEREQDYFEILSTETSRLSRLIHNVLEYSKLEKKQKFMEVKHSDFVEVINEVKSLMGVKLASEGFKLETNIQDGVTATFDSEVMVQVLMNLIDNSIKFGKSSSEKLITITIAERGAGAGIDVSDKGPGIPPKALKKVFDDFFRVEGSLTRTTGGTGIGLALVKKYIEAHNGTVTALNNEGQGCTISIHLPLNS